MMWFGWCAAMPAFEKALPSNPMLMLVANTNKTLSTLISAASLTVQVLLTVSFLCPETASHAMLLPFRGVQTAACIELNGCDVSLLCVVCSMERTGLAKRNNSQFYSATNNNAKTGIKKIPCITVLRGHHQQQQFRKASPIVAS